MSTEAPPNPIPSDAPAGAEALSKNALKKQLKADKAAALKAAKAKEKVSLVFTVYIADFTSYSSTSLLPYIHFNLVPKRNESLIFYL